MACPSRHSSFPAVLLTLALASVAVPLAGQQSAAGGIVLTGRVVDESTGKGLPYAVVSAASGEPHVIADSTGVFRFPGLPRGVQNLTAAQLGYARLMLPVPVAEGAEPVEFRLAPDPVALEGIKVMGDRFRGRRNALPVASQAFDRSRLEASPSRDVMDFLQNEGKLLPGACPGPSQGRRMYCFNRRGQVVQPQVFLDEALLPAGMIQLDGQLPNDFYLIEVIGNGLMIRAYTKLFVDRLSKNPRALEPITLR